MLEMIKEEITKLNYMFICAVSGSKTFDKISDSVVPVANRIKALKHSLEYFRNHKDNYLDRDGIKDLFIDVINTYKEFYYIVEIDLHLSSRENIPLYNKFLYIPVNEMYTDEVFDRWVKYENLKNNFRENGNYLKDRTAEDMNIAYKKLLDKVNMSNDFKASRSYMSFKNDITMSIRGVIFKRELDNMLDSTSFRFKHSIGCFD